MGVCLVSIILKSQCLSSNKYINEILELESIFGEKDWQAVQHTLVAVIIPALKAAQELYEDSSQDITKNIITLSW